MSYEGAWLSLAPVVAVIADQLEHPEDFDPALTPQAQGRRLREYLTGISRRCLGNDPAPNGESSKGIPYEPMTGHGSDGEGQ